MYRSIDQKQLGRVIRSAKRVAKQYRQLTKKPLGITGEIGEYEAARVLNLKLCKARQEGYDAIRQNGRSRKRIQIKTRCKLPNSKPGQRVGSIKLDKSWDNVLLVLLDENFDPIEMHEATRYKIKKALQAPGSKARNKRGALAVSKFISIAQKVWP